MPAGTPKTRWTSGRARLGVLVAGLCALTLIPVPGAAATPAVVPVPKLLFGVGPEAGPAGSVRLVKQAPVGMLTSWFNGSPDLAWITAWRTTVVPAAYAGGKALHLVVWSNSPEETRVTAKWGTTCGRRYPISTRFISDMRALAQTFAGSASGPPLYVTLFTEFQTYPCIDNQWNPTAAVRNYYLALMDQYRQALAIFHREAPNARVSLGWGGWQTRWDQPATGGGISLFHHFDAVMRESDFQSFQAMGSDTNVTDIRKMTQLLGQYGPVMLAHYKPENSSAVTFSNDVHKVLTDAYLHARASEGLFAISFMDSQVTDQSPPLFQFVRAAVRRYGRAAT